MSDGGLSGAVTLPCLQVVLQPVAALGVEAGPGCGPGQLGHQQFVVRIEVRHEDVTDLLRGLARTDDPGRVEVVPVPARQLLDLLVEGVVVLAGPVQVVADHHGLHGHADPFVAESPAGRAWSNTARRCKVPRRYQRIRPHADASNSDRGPGVGPAWFLARPVDHLA